jgi:hypothetical protein
MRLEVKPAYGWGWFKSGGGAVDVPTPFELEVTVLQAGQPFRVALGCCQSHLLSGLWHAPGDGQCNLHAFADKPEVPEIPRSFRIEPNLTGFATASQISTGK